MNSSASNELDWALRRLGQTYRFACFFALDAVINKRVVDRKAKSNLRVGVRSTDRDSGGVHLLSCNMSLQYTCFQQFRRRDRNEVPVNQDEVSLKSR